MVIKSTIPVGYCESLYQKYGSGLKLLFSPKFLRESKTLYDNLYPSRIIVGVPKDDTELQESAQTFVLLFVEGTIGSQKCSINSSLHTAQLESIA